MGVCDFQTLTHVPSARSDLSAPCMAISARKIVTDFQIWPGPGAETDRKIDRKPQAVNVISRSFRINSHLFSLYLHTYLHTCIY